MTVPPHLIETINRLTGTSQQVLLQTGREPTPEELADRLAMPHEAVSRLLGIAMTPVRG